jgi:serine/threonine protein phosphatase PrpC
MFLTWKPRTNTTSRRRSRWRRSSTTRRSLVTVSSTSGNSPTWPHASLRTTSSGVAALGRGPERLHHAVQRGLMVVANVGDSRVVLGTASNDGAITPYNSSST